jgi:hypothetical protein
MKRTSTRSRTIVAKASSISRLVLALRMSIGNSIRRAASCASRNVVSATTEFLGLTKHGHTAGLGNQLVQQSQPLRQCLIGENHPCQVAARPRQARDQTYRVAADAEHFVDHILRGSKPADLPVQAPFKHRTMLNLKLARALGLDVPPSGRRARRVV